MTLERINIGGTAHESEERDLIVNPFVGEPVGEAAVATADHVERAIELASAQARAAREAPSHQRIEVLERAATLVDEDRESIAQLISRESGNPIRFARGEVERAALTLRLGADVARGSLGETFPVDVQARAVGRVGYYQRVPLGPVAAITPFNFPLNLAVHKLSPAIAVGATAVLKPPPQAPLTAHRFARLLLDACLPPTWLSVLHCPVAIAERLVTDERMKVLSFTGSDAVGWKLKSLAGKKRVLLELGGNAPCIVDADVPLDSVLNNISHGAWAYAGQVCIKVQRIFVHRSLYDAFVEAFVAKADATVCGNPLDDETVLGPVIDVHQRDRVLSWIDEARAAGAQLRCGGDFDGNVIRPVVLTDSTPKMRVERDEVFGPVTTVTPFDDFGEAIDVCNDSRYGLQAGVFADRIANALRATRERDFGGVLINDVPTFRVDHAPYGGSGDSAMGREGVCYAANEMTEAKTIMWRAP